MLESTLTESGGEITDKLEALFEGNDLSIKEKVDAYGYVFTDIEKDREKLKTLKERIQSALKRVDNLESKLKNRLYYLADGAPLRGNLFSFHPYESTHKVINDPSKLSPSESFLTIEIRKDLWETLLGREPRLLPEGIFKVKSETARVSELPEGHPAIAIVSEPSVRIT